MFDKEIYKELASFDKKLSIALSLFVMIVSFAGILLINHGEEGITGFSVFETNEIGNISVGLVFLMVLFAAIISALVNIIYTLKPNK